MIDIRGLKEMQRGGAKGWKKGQKRGENEGSKTPRDFPNI